MIADCDRPKRSARALLVAMLLAALVSGGGCCVRPGFVLHGDWSLGVQHAPCGGCGSTRQCRRGCRTGNRGGRHAARPPVREYDGIPTVPRFHPVPTSPVLTDPALPAPTLAEPMPAPPQEYDTPSRQYDAPLPRTDADSGSGNGSGSGQSDKLPPPGDMPPPLPHEYDTGQHGGAGAVHPGETQQQRPGRSASRWAFRNAPPYYPRRR